MMKQLYLIILVCGAIWGSVNAQDYRVVEFKNFRFDSIVYVPEGDVYITINNDQFGLFGKEGEVIPSIYNELIFNFDQNYVGYSKAGLWGLADLKGNEILETKYSDICTYAASGIIPVKEGSKWKFINNKGEVLFDTQVDEIGDGYRDGVIEAMKGNKWGLMDDKGKFIVEPQYKFILYMANGYSMIEEGGNYGIIDKAGEYVLPPEFPDIAYTGEEGLESYCFVLDKNRWAAYNVDGTKYTEHLFAGWDVKIFTTPELVFFGEKDERYGAVNSKGKVIIPFEYDMTYPDDAFVGNDKILLSKDDFIGLMNTTGKAVIPFKYDQIEGFSDGYAYFTRGNSSGLISLTGKEVLMQDMVEILKYGDGVARYYTQEGEWKLINKAQKVIATLDAEIQWIFQFQEGLAAAKKGGLIGFIDKRGKFKMMPAYKEVYFFENGLAAGKRGRSWYFIKKESM